MFLSRFLQGRQKHVPKTKFRFHCIPQVKTQGYGYFSPLEKWKLCYFYRLLVQEISGSAGVVSACQ